MSKYTIKDIAQIAGVSTGTVSRVLNRAGNVAPGIYQRTMDAIRQTDYKPGTPGRKVGHSVKASRHIAADTIAVLFPDMSKEWQHNPLWASYVAGIEKACRERNFHMNIYMGERNIAAEQMVSNLSSRVAGALIKTSLKTPELFTSLNNAMPVVGFGAYMPSYSIPQVSIDNNAIGVVATEQLLKLGHRKIAFVNPEANRPDFIARSQGYIEVMKRECLYDSALLLERRQIVEELSRPRTTPDDMGWVLDHFKQHGTEPSAVIFVNDWLAYGFYRACAARGIIIPDDFSVVGMDNVGTLCDILNPPLSSMELPFMDVACFAANTLIDILQGAGRHLLGRASAHYISGRFILRDSVKDLNTAAILN